MFKLQNKAYVSCTTIKDTQLRILSNSHVQTVQGSINYATPQNKYFDEQPKKSNSIHISL